ncbi:hypothetical protein AALD01_05095 [Oscillospiraceae bacterium 21-37]
MLFSPFALEILDGDFYLPQYFLAALAHRRAQGRGGGRGVKIKHTQKIFVLQVAVRVKTTAGQQHIEGAAGAGIAKAGVYVFLVQLLQKGALRAG